MVHNPRFAITQRNQPKTDRELLSRFATDRDDSAFTELLHRLGPMVLGVCQRVLRNHASAEDAFQNTFLVLAHRANAVHGNLSPWLYGVAWKIAHKARTKSKKQQTWESKAAKPEAIITSQDNLELRHILDEVISNLPQPLQQAIITCLVNGHSRSQAAKLLNWPEGTVAKRLAKARKLLVQRLTRRGIIVSVSSLTAFLNWETSAKVSASLLDQTKQNCMMSLGGSTIGMQITSLLLAEGTTRFSKWSLIIAATCLLGLGIVCGRYLFPAITPDLHQEDKGQLATKPAPLAEKLNPNEHELHVIGIYGAKKLKENAPVEVEVQPTTKPIVLVLTSYFSVEWKLKLAPGAKLRKVILSGYNQQNITGVPAEVPIARSSYYPDEASRKEGWFFSYEWNTPGYREMVRRLNDKTALPIATFQSEYEGTSFVVDGKRGIEATQKELNPAAPPANVPTSDELRKLAEGAELHIVGSYMPHTRNKGKAVDVEVKATNKPIVLALSSYSECVWNIRQAEAANIKAVILCGHAPQEVEGLDAKVPIIYRCPSSASYYFSPAPAPVQPETFYAYKAETVVYRRAIDKLNQLTGLLVSTFQGSYYGRSFTIDGEGGKAHAQLALKPKRKNFTTEEVLAASKGAELHLVSIGRGEEDAPVEVTIQPTGKPIILALAAYNETIWKLKIEKGADVKAVLIGGYFEQEVDGLPESIPVKFESHFPLPSKEHFWGHKKDSIEYPKLLTRLKELSSLNPSTTQLADAASSFTIDGKQPADGKAAEAAMKPEPIEPAPPVTKEKTEWFQKNIVPLKTMLPTNDDYADLEPIAKAIGTSRIVLLGEQTHGDGATFLAKTRLIQFLHQKHGFDLLIFESGFYDCHRAWQTILEGKLSAIDAASEGIFGIWTQSQQVQPLLEYIAKQAKSKNPLQLAGCDSQLTGLASSKYLAKELERVLKTIPNDLLKPADRERTIEACQTMIGGDKPSKEEREAFTLAVNALNKHQATKDLSEKDLLYWRQTVESLATHAESMQYSSNKPSDQQKYGNTRDTQMGKNLIWHARQNPNRKIIVWAASYHNMRNQPKVNSTYQNTITLGDVAWKTLGKEIYSIAFTASEGKWKLPWFNQLNTIQPPIPGSLEDYFAKTTHDFAFLNLRDLTREANWLKDKLPARPMGYQFFSTSWPEIFDAFIYTRTMTGSDQVKE